MILKNYGFDESKISILKIAISYKCNHISVFNKATSLIIRNI
jgi:hypothetical protein